MMARNLWFILIAFFSHFCFAQKTSTHLAHPIAWMYFLPTGETPGWQSPEWFNLEFSQSNVYNRSSKFLNLKNGEIIQYEADYEQSSLILEVGHSPTENLMLSLEVPIAYRGGGIFDNGIDEFHKLIQSDRFMRSSVGPGRSIFSIYSDDEQRIKTNHFSGVLTTMKSKIKYWILPWGKEYGLSVSTQLKTGVGGRNSFTSGGFDMSFLIHAGAPIRSQSGIWFTSGFTKISPNNVFADWSARQWLQMYELTTDLALTDEWGLVGFFRMESPLFNVGDFAFLYTQNSQTKQAEERTASGWNSLMYWRGSQGMGGRYRWQSGDQLNFLVIEDWAFGGYDKRASNLYVNNAPDVSFVFQLHYAL